MNESRKWASPLQRVWIWAMVIGMFVAVGSEPVDSQSAGIEPSPVSDEVAMKALAEAVRFVEVTYQLDGEPRQGVAYAWGGRMGVDAYLSALQAGKRPGVDAGVDASGVVVQAYLAADPTLSFVTAWGGEPRSVKDATSATLYHWNVEAVPVEAMRPGDLIFFKGEGGEVAGVAVFERREGPNVHFVVASLRQGKVVRTFLNVRNEYWNTRFLGAGRLLDHAQ